MIQSNYDQIYEESCLALAGSIVLKNSESARLLNLRVDTFVGSGLYKESDPTTWMYYKHLSGEYFSTDKVMTVSSLDNLQTIEFNKKNLAFHKATAKAYQFGSTYYKELVSRYPDQEQLIRGILYPCDIAAAIAAQDGQILAYPSDYVESTEYSFIPNLQAWIYGFLARWSNKSFRNTDALYEASMLGVLYLHMVPAIKNIRLAACKTHEAHSYHVRNFLASHSRLDKYLPYMTRSQTMWFYRNIVWIEHNNGSEAMRDVLIDKLFTERNLPIGEFKMIHELENMPGELSPEIAFRKTPLNTAANPEGLDVYTLKQVLDMHEKLLPSNALYREEDEPKIREQFKNSLSSSLPTKLLESSVVDYTDSERYRFSDMVFRHWAWLSYKGYYGAFIRITTPVTGQVISLSVKDAFVFFVYASMAGQGFVLKRPPKVLCNMVVRMPPATLQDVRAVAEVKHVSDAWIEEIRATMPAPNRNISIESFYGSVRELWQAANVQYKMSCMEEGLTARAQKHSAYLRLWADQLVDFIERPDQTYTDWFSERNIAIKDFSERELASIAQQLLNAATGQDLVSTITLKDIQQAMCSMLTDLSSYSIEVAATINIGPVIQAGFAATRFDNWRMNVGARWYLNTATVRASQLRVTHYLRRFSDLSAMTRISKWRQLINSKITYQLSKIPPGGQKIAPNFNYRIQVRDTVSAVLPALERNPYGLMNIPGQQLYLDMPEEVRQNLPDPWDYPAHV